METFWSRSNRGNPRAVPDDHQLDDLVERTVVFDRRELVDKVPPVSTVRNHVLVRMDGSEIGQVTRLTGGDVEMGRHAKCSLHLPFEGVSRQHARVFFRDGTYWIEDTDSANGTFVRGIRITCQELSDGDVIQLGPRVVFRYSVTDESEERILRQLYESSVKDSLTGVYNREYLSERLKAEVAYAKRHHLELSVLMIDIDEFKRVNDTHGHPAGDAVLASTAATIARALRGEDVLARYGGEEFVAVLRGITLAGAAGVGERLRSIVEASTVAHAGTIIRCTISVGCASLSCAGAGASADALVAVADRRLYLAKRAGRNRVLASG